MRSFLLFLAGTAPLLWPGPFAAGAETPPAPLYAFCGAGDNLWSTDVEPVDSPASLSAMFRWMKRGHGVERMYWRAVSNWGNREARTLFTDPLVADWGTWMNRQIDEHDIDRSAVRAAGENGMEIFLYAGLFEYGVQPDAKGSSGGYYFEDRLRIAHPEWCGVDRWGERREPGISFAYPEARRAIIDRYLRQIADFGYDGVNFYTYVENFAIRYEHEFGFEPAVVERFNQRYPDVDLRRAALAPEQAEYWYACRGHFVTEFLREFHRELAAAGKKLSMILDADDPDYVQPWWGMPIRGAGKIRMDYETWIREGLVDEIWVQLAGAPQQMKLLDRLLELTKGTAVRLAVRTVDPKHAQWTKYREQGVSPIAVITWKKNGIERYSPPGTEAADLKSPDWMRRAQALRDIAAGLWTAAPRELLPLQSDAEALVRYNFYPALATLAAGDAGFVPGLEQGLEDAESCVRIAAIKALRKAHRPESAAAILAAIVRRPDFQSDMEAVNTLEAIGAGTVDVLTAALTAPEPPARKIAVRALYKLAITRKTEAEPVFAGILARLSDPEETPANRLWAMAQLVGMRAHLPPERRQELILALCAHVEAGDDVTLQLKAAESLRYCVGLATPPMRLRARAALKGLFAQYGDDCARPDAAFGWRVAGNALRAFGEDGTAALRDFLERREDRHLAYSAYQTLYEIQDICMENKGFCLIDEAEAIRLHGEFAPTFPGWRAW